ncbi:FHA domain-containing protein [Streptomyces sp. URMC 129]|uniref:FHA domain-containing protein n=1 Tax=Streptomyces sp. URMC 129 TaxID=3423407 RepID=UPI003F1A81A2
MKSNQESLARGVAPATPGTLHARSVTGDIRVPPRIGLTVSFGRDRPVVDLCVGEDDLRVSRRHGELTFRRGQWWLRNTGRQLVRLPLGRLMHLTTDPVPLAAGYTPVVVRGSGHREHLIELYVTDDDEPPRTPRHAAPTLPPKRWPLSDEERLLLVVLAQRYLLYEEGARPLTYRQAVDHLKELDPATKWTERKAEYRVEAIRRRLSRAGGFPHPLLREDDAVDVSDNSLMHNLLRGLVESTTLVPPDLLLIDPDPA